MRANNKNLTLLSELEREAFFRQPRFDEFQRSEYFTFTAEERALALQRKGWAEQLLCMLQIGYFKAARAFFSFTLEQCQEDADFLLARYFPEQSRMAGRSVRRAEILVQRQAILRLSGYRFYAAQDQPPLADKTRQLVRRDVTPAFVVTELLAWLDQQRIVRPGYTTFQSVISAGLTEERQRLAGLIEAAMTDDAKQALERLLVREDALSGLAAIKQDAKYFGPHMMSRERHKRAVLEPIYRVAESVPPKLEISRQNLDYYASLAHFYTVYDLRKLRPGQSALYLLCYAWQRYRQFNDNLVDALRHHTKKFEDESKVSADQAFTLAQLQRQKDTPQVGRLLQLYVDETLDDATSFGSVRDRAFSILPKATLQQVAQLLSDKSVSQMELRWRAIDKAAGQIRIRLQPQAMTLDLSSTRAGDPWLAAVNWMRGVFARRQRLDRQPLAEAALNVIPKRLRPYLLTFDEAGQPVSLRGDRYEFWLYRQLRKRIESGELHLDDSFQHRRFSDHLVPADRTAVVLGELDLAWLRRPSHDIVGALCDELGKLWQQFDSELRRGKLKHLEYDEQHATLRGREPKVGKEDTEQESFYAQLPLRDIADIIRFVNERCGFLSAMKPLQPRYAKKIADNESLMAVIIAQATNLGNLAMSQICDIPYHVLDETFRQYCRLATLREANDRIANFIAQLPIFEYYSFDLEVLFGAVDGQKFEAARPTAKSRYSSKYFGRGRGVVAHTFLANHVALRTELIGAHEHESHFVFDICYRNTTDIVPTAITGDMHSVNKANFSIMYWFEREFAPRFTSPQAQLKHLYCSDDLAQYDNFLIKPVGQIDRGLICDDPSIIEQIIASLSVKEISQQALVRKLCALSPHHRTRKAVFEFDKLVRSVYTLRYLRDPQLQRNVHRSQNRIEAYHALRGFIAEVGGKKHLIGKTDHDIAISNECGRLLANIVTAFNSVLLSTLLERYQREGNQKALAMLKKISPVAWQHIHFLGHYVFRNENPIDPAAMLAGLDIV
ncbi:Tn3 family transposase [Paraburkholderia sp. UYCP14C]|uniref:Tn3 family transposase n=1 Tax=Paraburkholderia sp. UYCP14C TaxID=2511130 RepID=UPI001020E241|nr:Tn3 family transposase [Paraburkholderia sp. UYCP14C]RZF23723.1 Tn3 family transposase [Paraburkholderia sp. UYCP14C]